MEFTSQNASAQAGFSASTSDNGAQPPSLHPVKTLSKNTVNFIVRHLIGFVFAALVFAGLEWLFGRAA